MAWETERKLLAETDATFVSLANIPIMRTRELTRRWDRLSDKHAETCLDFLSLYATADTATFTTPVYYVDSPKAAGPRGSETWAGRWRNAAVMRTKESPAGIVQVLRLGYLGYSGSPTAPLDVTEARLGWEKGTPKTGDKVILEEWRYCNPADHVTILNALTAITTATNPTVEGQVHTGLFACGEITGQPNEDGSEIWRRILTELSSINTVANLAALVPMVTQEEEIINYWGFNAGTEDKLLYVYDGIDPASQTYLMETMTAANFQNSIAPAGGGWIYVDRKFQLDPKTGSATFAVLFMNETWPARVASEKKSVSVTGASGWMRSLLIQTTGMNKTNALADFAALVDEVGAVFSASTAYNKGDIVTYPTVSDPKYIFTETHAAGAWNAAHVIAAHYLLGTRRVTEGARGEFTVTGDMVSVYNGTAEADAVVVRVKAALTSYERPALVRVWFRRSLAAKTTLTTITTGNARKNPAAAIDGVTYTHHEFTVDDHGDGAYTVRQILWGMLTESQTPLVIRIKPAITEHQQRMVVRIWKHLTEAAKILLMADGPSPGLARSNFTGVDEAGVTVTYTFADVHVTDGEEDGYTVSQLGIQVHTGTANTDALVVRRRPMVTFGPNRLMQRVWLHRSTAAKNTLTAATGNAVKNYSETGGYTVSWTHVDCHIDDAGDGAYNITQTLVELNDGATDADCLITHIKPGMTETSPKWISREWKYRSDAARAILTDLSVGLARLDATFESVTYQHYDCHIADREAGGYHVTQILRQKFTATDFMLIQIKPNTTEWEQKLVMRIWRHLDKTVKDALIASSGAARSAYTFETIAYVHMHVWVDDDGDNGYSVRQLLMEVHTGTTEADALVTQIRPNAAGHPAMIRRTWLHRSTTAKNTLIGATGKARVANAANLDGASTIFTHADCYVEDHGNGAYTVTQILVDLTDSVNYYWAINYDTKRVLTRASDDSTRTLTYTHYIKMHSTEKDAWTYVQAAGPNVVTGTQGVQKVSPVMFRSQHMVLATPIPAWTP